MAQGPWTCPIASQVVIFVMVSCLPNSLGPLLVWWSGGKLLRGSARLKRNFPTRLLTLEYGQHARHPFKSNMTLLVSRVIIARQGQPQKICWQLWGLRGPWLNLMPNQLLYPKKNVRGYYVGAKSSHEDFLTKLFLCRGYLNDRNSFRLTSKYDQTPENTIQIIKPYQTHLSSKKLL